MASGVSLPGPAQPKTRVLLVHLHFGCQACGGLRLGHLVPKAVSDVPLTSPPQPLAQQTGRHPKGRRRHVRKTARAYGRENLAFQLGGKPARIAAWTFCHGCVHRHSPFACWRFMAGPTYVKPAVRRAPACRRWSPPLPNEGGRCMCHRRRRAPGAHRRGMGGGADCPIAHGLPHRRNRRREGIANTHPLKIGQSDRAMLATRQWTRPEKR